MMGNKCCMMKKTSEVRVVIGYKKEENPTVSN
jgi:hypothetical protein